MNQWLFTFVDILGFADEVKSIATRDAMEKLKVKVSDFVSNFAVDIDLNETVPDSDDFPEDGVILKCFSDSVLRAKKLPANPGAAINSEIFEIIRAINWCIQAGYLVRGGIAIGHHFEGLREIHGGRSVPFIISPALIDAYKMETTIAKFPRIVVGPEVIGYLDPANRNLLYWYRNVASLNYLWFDYLTNYDPGSDVIGAHVASIESGLGHVNSKVKAKYRWLKNYHNSVVENIFLEDRDGNSDISFKIQRTWYPYI